MSNAVTLKEDDKKKHEDRVWPVYAGLGVLGVALLGFTLFAVNRQKKKELNILRGLEDVEESDIDPNAEVTSFFSKAKTRMTSIWNYTSLAFKQLNIMFGTPQEQPMKASKDANTDHFLQSDGEEEL